MDIQIEWDSQKNKGNLIKHGLSFEDARLVFEGDVLTFVDGRHNYGEDRYITIGKLLGREVVIVHTYRNGKIRIISMRKANEREKKNCQK